MHSQRANTFGGHQARPPAPADGGAKSGNTWGGGNPDVEKAAAGNTNGGQSMKDVIEAHQWLSSNSRGVAHGQTHGASGYQLDRINACKQRTGWDGDLRWPPHEFLVAEEERNNRLDAMERQQQEIAWERGQQQLWQMRRERAQAESPWAGRAPQGPSAYPPPPYGRR